MSGGGSKSQSSSTNETVDNRTMSDAESLAQVGTSSSQAARDSGIAANSAMVAQGGSLFVSGGQNTVTVTDGGAVQSALDLVRDAGTAIQDSTSSLVSELLSAKANASGNLSSNQVTLLIIGAVATAIAARTFK